MLTTCRRSPWASWDRRHPCLHSAQSHVSRKAELPRAVGPKLELVVFPPPCPRQQPLHPTPLCGRQLPRHGFLQCRVQRRARDTGT